MWRFKINHVDAPAPLVFRISGIAYRNRKSTRYFLTINPFFTALSVEPTWVGRKLIAHYIRLLGEPTLKYHDKHGYYEDYTVEWHLSSNAGAIVRRIQQHLALGFTPEELP